MSQWLGYFDPFMEDALHDKLRRSFMVVMMIYLEITA